MPFVISHSSVDVLSDRRLLNCAAIILCQISYHYVLRQVSWFYYCSHDTSQTMITLNNIRSCDSQGINY